MNRKSDCQQGPQQEAAVINDHIGVFDGAAVNHADCGHRTRLSETMRPLDGADNDSRRGGISPPQFVPRRHASILNQSKSAPHAHQYP